MRAKILHLFIISLALVLSSCTKADDTPEVVYDYLEISDINCVWIKNYSYDDVFYIYFSASETYSFCLNNTLMGCGRYSLDKNVITLYNSYSYSKDILKVELNNNALSLSGNILKFNQTDYEKIDYTFRKSQEDFPKSIIGESVGGVIATSKGWKVETMTILSENTLNYKLTDDNKPFYSIEQYDVWFYVYRNGITYTQVPNSDGEVSAYNAPYGTTEYFSPIEDVMLF